MLVIRPAHHDDLDALMALATEATTGITTLPSDREFLSRRVTRSRRNFEDMPDRPQGEDYLFVLEDTDIGRVVGTSAVMSKVGGFKPFYAYRVVPRIHESMMLNVRKEIQELQLVRKHDGPCEIGSLFLHGPHRKGGGGRLLSLSRFLFMAEHPAAFESVVIAEMRGVISKDGHSPFWEAVGRHFFDIDLAQADYLSMVNKQFIAELMPKHPIYLPLLPREAQIVMGEVHEETRAALKLLQDEGFKPTGMIDIFEAGPIMGCRLPEIRSVRESTHAVVAEIADRMSESAPFLVANTAWDFRSCTAVLEEVELNRIRISHQTAAALQIQKGDSVRYVSPHPTKTVPPVK